MEYYAINMLIKNAQGKNDVTLLIKIGNGIETKYGIISTLSKIIHIHRKQN